MLVQGTAHVGAPVDEEHIQTQLCQVLGRLVAGKSGPYDDDVLLLRRPLLRHPMSSSHLDVEHVLANRLWSVLWQQYGRVAVGLDTSLTKLLVEGCQVVQ